MSLQCILVSERRLHRHQRKRYAHVLGCLDMLDMFWMAYSAGKMMTSVLLKKCLWTGASSLNSVKSVTSRPRT